MKKKWLLATLTLTCAAAGVFGLAACDEHEHTWDGGTVTTAATCTTAGEKTFACTHEGCEETKTEAIAATDHAWKEGEGTDATCTTDGVKNFACTNAGCTETKTETVTATDHDWGEWKVTPATCTEGGITTRVCKNNAEHKETKDETQPRAHKWSAWDVLVNDDGGQASKTCEYDGCEGHVTVELPALTEKAAYAIEDTATCAEDGKITYTFTTEDEEEIEVKVMDSPAKGHSFGAPQNTDPVGEAKGKVTFACENDGCEVKDVYEYDAKSNASGNVTVEAGKTYYMWSENPSTDPEAAPITKAVNFRNFALKKGTYEFTFKYLDSKLFTVVEAVNKGCSVYANTKYNAVFSGGEIVDAYKDNIKIEKVGGNVVKMTVIVDGVIIKADDKLNYAMTTPLEPSSSTAVLMSVSFEQAKELKVGDNTVKITEAGVTVDEYEFTPTETKSYSITVPQGVTVYQDSIDKKIADSGTGNFTATANKKIKFIFYGSEVKDHTVTIGEAIEITELSVGCNDIELQMVSQEFKSLVVGNDVEEGLYTIKMSGQFLIGRGTGYGILYFNVNCDANYNSVTSNTTGLCLQMKQVPTVKGDWNATTKAVPWTVTLTLKAGDVVYFAPAASYLPAGSEIAPIYVTMEKAA